MNRKLHDTLYSFAEDSQISFPELMEVAKRFGKTFASEPELLAFKNAADAYLQTKTMESLDKLDNLLK